MPTRIAALALASGAAGLIYEVLWAKQLALVLGSSAAAQATVLAVFLGGLSLGYALFGLRADRHPEPLRLFGHLELGTAALGMASPWLIAWIGRAYRAALAAGLAGDGTLDALEEAAAAAALLPATVLMGGTLPALARAASGGSGEERGVVGRLYFLNSLGAAAGALLAGFLLIPLVGIELSVLTASAVNIAVAVAALRRAPEARAAPSGPPTEPRPPVPVPVQRVVLAVVLLSGALTLLYETAWIRLMTLVLGGSAYSFALMVSAFITGLALGGWVSSRPRALKAEPVMALAWAQIGTAVATLGAVFLCERLPYAFARLDQLIPRSAAAYPLHEGAKFLLSFASMTGPALFAGLSLPLAARAAGSALSPGLSVGRTFGLGTLGNVAGAAAGPALLASAGLQGLFEGGALLQLCLGSTCALLAPGRSRVRAAALALSAAAAAVCVFHDYEADRRILSAGAYRGGSAPHAGWKAFKDAHDDGELLYYKDGLQATVAVVRSPSGPLSLRVNGKVDASTGADMGTQLLIAHLPLVLRPKARDVLLVGLGSGITAGAVLAHPVERLSVVEIDEAVVEAERFFREHNGRPLSDPRLTLRVADAKVALRSDPRPYDLIISEPSNPWLAGMGNLFTVEFYRAAKAKLRPGGAMVQWFHLYEMDDETVRLILRTYASVFSEVTAWTSPAGDLLLIGTDRTHGGDPKGLEDAFERPAVAADLRRIGVRSLTTLLSLEAATDETVRGIAGRGPLNSDMHPHLEYRAPRAFFMRTRAQVMDRYDDRLRPGAPLVIWDYLAERGRGLAVRELAEIAAFARLIGGRWGAYFRTRA